MLGDFVLMNLFLALLLDNFSSGGDQSTTKPQENKSTAKLVKRRSKISPIEASKQRIIRRMVVMRTGSSAVQWQTPREGRRNSSRHDLPSTSQNMLTATPVNSLTSNTMLAARSGQRENTRNLRTRSLTTTRSYNHQARETQGMHEAATSHRSSITAADSNKLAQPYGKSLYLFGPEHCVRLWAFKLSTHPWFHAVMFGLIVVHPSPWL
ncbi:unnamed protein product [Phytophthora lilii]|uniref:Unnamed protein product n=1 Tax=Phytophthora lilii TaxID=2077276 RepID=A0A9W6XRF5_9STRA|nr:unnamed protein product [Phytophthora lilii]